MRNQVRFLRRGKVKTLSGFAPTLTLLDYLRLTERATGTKEGCAEGRAQRRAEPHPAEGGFQIRHDA